MAASAAEPMIAVDWGTTNRRVYLIEGGVAVRTERDDRGVKAVDDFAAEVAGIRSRFGDHLMLLAGMVGSTIGWREAPYVPAPAGVAQIAANLLFVDRRTAIVPGVSTRSNGRADVMRGEEVQLFGAIAAGLAPADSLLVQPGTHCKWVRMESGRVMDFTTAMTGELFALLRNGSVLAPQLIGDAVDGEAFRAGVAEAARCDLAASLFGIRAASLLGIRDDADTSAFASGLLIGSDVRARLAENDHAVIHILAGPELGRLYVAAIEAHGREARIVDSPAAFVAGIVAIPEHRS